VDRGGTFTDVVRVGEHGVSAEKVPSDGAVVGRLAEGRLVFGTTVATNALLESAGVRVLLLVTRGFEDLIRLGDMTRPELLDPDGEWPAPLVTRVVPFDGRHGPDGGEVVPLRVPALDFDGIDAVAIVAFGSGWNPAHELALAACIPAAHPVSLGHRLAPEVGYLARIEAAVLDAAITPILAAAMKRDEIPPGALAMRSDGSLCPAESLRAPDAVLSGPAGGVLAVEAVLRLAGRPLGVGFDMGGTSTDVSLVEPGRLVRREAGWRVGGRRVGRACLEVETIAAGGGSVLGHDGVGYTVGPASAGAHPGPQALGRGGPPTLTDAALAAGLLSPAHFPQELHLDRIALPGPPEAFLAVAQEGMAAAVRRLALRRGVDLRGASLVAFGGAAGQHCCAVAERLGLDEVLVHAAAPVLSAWGQALAVRAQEAVEALWCRLDRGRDRVEAALARLAPGLPDWSEREAWVEVRALGTDAALPLRWEPPESLAARFDAAHRARYGFGVDAARLEVVNVRLRVAEAAPEAPPAPPWPADLPPCTSGPARLLLPGTTLVLPAGWEARVEGALLRVTRTGGRLADRVDTDRDTALALWAQRFSAVAEGAGEVLRRTARSVNIRERLDFSCAVFSGAGELVANAPHVPVHLGAMGDTVTDVLAAFPDMQDGDAWLTNDPVAGGSHLPDLTVVRCVMHGGQRLFVANRAHHVDVGGLTPGSMPPHSTHIDEEGLRFRRWPLLRAGRLNLPDLRGSRDPDTVALDLQAQLAANETAARALVELGPPELLAHWMHELVAAVRSAVAAVLPGLAGSAEDELDGLPLRVHIGDGVVDFSGTGGPHPGNLNAPRAVVRAAVLYVLRVVLGRPLPLNEGVLQAVRIVVPAGSLLDPPPTAAVCGGNVETSQRLVDLLFRALGLRADGQGTMNNLSLGGADWAFYETLGGGLGASAAGPGRSSGQVHMTNTRATDPEVMEARLPLRVWRFASRPGSGGGGRHRGGDGLVRELEVLRGGKAALLAAWRPDGARGLGGGENGLPGAAFLIRPTGESPWDGAAVVLAAGDRVRVLTPGGGGWGGGPAPRNAPGPSLG
jgi:5-oxoprolinase (ATP-hydrolysing)